MKKIAGMIMIAIMVCSIVGCSQKKAVPINLPEINTIQSIAITIDDETENFSDSEWINQCILSITNAQITTKESIQEMPQVDEYIEIDINTENGVSTLFVYKEKDHYYIEQPYQGIYLTDLDFYEMLTEKKTISADTKEQNKAYGEILWNVYYLGQIEGKEVTFPNADGNKNGGFAIFDIDGDGYEELLLYFDGGSMALNVEYIWGYKNGSTHIELSEFPQMSYYDNGIIEVDWSHNQGLAGDFWPYSVYIYNSEIDEYQEYGAVDAWDKNSTKVEVNWRGETFPSNIDEDGDGIVYYIFPADWEGYNDAALVDGKDYESWKNGYLDKAEEIKDIPFQMLNEENISKLGAPKPDIQFPEPLG